MRMANATDTEYERPGTRHREGNIRFKYLLRGEAGSPQNYELMLAHTGAGFPSPPHRHNFDQIRFCLRGRFGDGKGMDVKEGHCGYYPEGASYSIDSAESEVILLQFGGASGSGFTHFPQLFRAYAELAQLGEFRDGRFYRAPAPGAEPDPRAQQDGYEALWQHIHGRQVVYPEPRYARPIIMDTQAFEWRQVQPGVLRKTLGLFTERAIETGQYRLDAGARWEASGWSAPCLMFVLEGGGRSGDVAWNAGAAVELAGGESLVLDSAQGMLLFYAVLPTFDAGERRAA